MPQANQIVLPDTEKNEDIRRAIIDLIPPAGSLGLPKLLDERRLQYAITSGAFKLQMAFDRVLVFQIPDENSKDGKFGKDSALYKSDQGLDRDKLETPRGVLISAGARALDILHSNGIDLGHIVAFISSQPWRLFFDYVAGKRIPALPMNVGDIIGSEDLGRNIVEGKVKVKRDEETGLHVYVDEDGKQWNPQQPWAGADSI